MVLDNLVTSCTTQYTKVEYNVVAAPGEQYSLMYRFLPNALLESRSFGLQGMLYYHNKVRASASKLPFSYSTILSTFLGGRKLLIGCFQPNNRLHRAPNQFRHRHPVFLCRACRCHSSRIFRVLFHVSAELFKPKDLH